MKCAQQANKVAITAQRHEPFRKGVRLQDLHLNRSITNGDKTWIHPSFVRLITQSDDGYFERHLVQPLKGQQNVS
jgi:hypothetical protein